MKTAVIITARMNSSRVPGKCMVPIHGKPALAICIENCKRQKEPVILAIRKDPEDDVLEALGKSLDVEVYRGEDNSPFHRILSIINSHRLHCLVRITADDILIDPELLTNQIAYHVSSRSDYTTMGSVPQGMAGEVISAEAYRQAAVGLEGKEIEHVSYYLKLPDQDFVRREYKPPRAYRYPHFSLMLDNPDDIAVLNLVLGMVNGQANTLDIINVMKSKYVGPAISSINRVPAVTLYTCVYNHEKYIEDCLDSILSQTFEDYELIIIDDGSEDNTPARISEWISALSDEDLKRVKSIRHKENRGLAFSSNEALHLAKGRFICRVDSDDIILPDFVRIVHREILLSGSSMIVSAYYETDENLVAEPLKTDNGQYHPGCALMETGAAKDVLYRDGLQHFEGLEFFGRFKKRFRVHKIQDALWYYRKHNKSKTADRSE